MASHLWLVRYDGVREDPQSADSAGGKTTREVAWKVIRQMQGDEGLGWS